MLVGLGKRTFSLAWWHEGDLVSNYFRVSGVSTLGQLTIGAEQVQFSPHPFMYTGWHQNYRLQYIFQVYTTTNIKCQCLYNQHVLKIHLKFH